MVFHHFSTIFPRCFHNFSTILIFSTIFHHFPLVFLHIPWFPYGFPTVFLSAPPSSHVVFFRNAVAKFLTSACLPRTYAESWRRMNERPKTPGLNCWTGSTRVSNVFWLVVWNMNFLTFHSVGKNNPNWRTHIFQRGWNHQPVSISG